mmetsp:Transcript_85070/g.245670  ORF Transcript_85070/g.245670 Transcript_85070/m.245670 type:complete len:312 (-) Transcript_85070:228-1163(-)
MGQAEGGQAAVAGVSVPDVLIHDEAEGGHLLRHGETHEQLHGQLEDAALRRLASRVRQVAEELALRVVREADFMDGQADGGAVLVHARRLALHGDQLRRLDALGACGQESSHLLVRALPVTELAVQELRPGFLLEVGAEPARPVDEVPSGPDLAVRRRRPVGSKDGLLEPRAGHAQANDMPREHLHGQKLLGLRLRGRRDRLDDELVVHGHLGPVAPLLFDGLLALLAGRREAQAHRAADPRQAPRAPSAASAAVVGALFFRRRGVVVGALVAVRAAASASARMPVLLVGVIAAGGRARRARARALGRPRQ